MNATQFTRIRPLALALSLMGTAACTNPETPEGFEGYVHHVPLLLGHAEYRDTMVGPASTGVAWRLFVINIDTRAKSVKEDFSLLTSDNLSVAFEVNTRMRVRPGQVKEIVEEWGGENWYDWNVKEPLRTVVRRNITTVSAVDIQLSTDEVRQQIYEAALEKYGDSPIEILSVDIGNIRFPPEVTKAIERKIATEQELERQQFVLDKTRKEAAIHVLEALRVAKQQQIISATLDPIYVQRMGIQAYRALAESPNKTVMVLPNAEDGTGLPLVLSDRAHKTLSEDDRKLLDEMEVRYMAIAGSQTQLGADDESEAAPEPAPGELQPSGAEAEDEGAKDTAPPAAPSDE